MFLGSWRLNSWLRRSPSACLSIFSSSKMPNLEHYCILIFAQFEPNVNVSGDIQDVILRVRLMTEKVHFTALTKSSNVALNKRRINIYLLTFLSCKKGPATENVKHHKC